MAITPQAIKDQEFQNRFRGYDPIEVKAYLELVAEEFFELREQIRALNNDVAERDQEKELFEELKEKLESDRQRAIDASKMLKQQCEEQDSTLAELTKELDELQMAQADFEQERHEFEEDVSTSEARVSTVEAELKKSQGLAEKLKSKISLLEEQNQELKNEEVDFKRTIGAAQKFVDELKKNAQEQAAQLAQQSEQRAQELLTSSQRQANQSLQSARQEIEKLRKDAFAELSRLPQEIEKLNHQRQRIRDELREILTVHLDQLNSFTEVEEHVKHYEYDELFQKIELPAAMLPSDPVQASGAGGQDPGERESDFLDELDAINMDLDLPAEASLEIRDDSDDDDDLRNKLEQGGVAYLSDG